MPKLIPSVLQLHCWLWMGPGWLGGCSWAEFWVQQGVLILLGCCSSTLIQPCPQEQSNKAMSWQDPTDPGDEAALGPHLASVER